MVCLHSTNILLTTKNIQFLLIFHKHILFNELYYGCSTFNNESNSYSLKFVNLIHILFLFANLE